MNVRDLVKKHESLRLYCYDDSTGARLEKGDKPTGIPTIGYGHTGPDIVPGMIVSEAEAEDMLTHDLISAEGDCRWVFGKAWDSFCEPRQAAFIDMAFNVGRTGISEFQRMIHDAIAGDWFGAYTEAMHSRWASQVHHRAVEDAAMIHSGRWLDAAQA